LTSCHPGLSGQKKEKTTDNLDFFGILTLIDIRCRIKYLVDTFSGFFLQLSEEVRDEKITCDFAFGLTALFYF
jgi:hypothetical protein